MANLNMANFEFAFNLRPDDEDASPFAEPPSGAILQLPLPLPIVTANNLILPQNTPASDNVISHLNHDPNQQDINKFLELRKLIYATRDAFHADCETDNESAIPDDIKTLCTEIEESVEKGRAVLADTMKKYIEARDIVANCSVSTDIINSSFDTARNHILRFQRECMRFDHSVQVVDSIQSILADLQKVQQQVIGNINTDLPEHHQKLKEATHMLTNMAGAFRTLRNTSTMYTCPICLDRQVSRFIIPCGHTYCVQCLGRSGVEKCAICRTTVNGVKDLYFC
jgi:uncharacterized protein Yka (UPF0111/DUF47 family)